MSLKYLTFQHTEHYMFKIWNTFCFNCVSVIIYCSSFKDDPAVLQGTSCRVWIETSYTVSFSASSLPACCFKSYYFFKLHCPLELASKGKKEKKEKSLFPLLSLPIWSLMCHKRLFFLTNTYYWYVFAHCKKLLVKTNYY